MATRSLTVEPGFVNKNRQKILQRAGWIESDRDGQYVYHVQCQVTVCRHEYGTDGISFHQRKCPRCQDGKPGLPVPEKTASLFD